MVSGYAHFYVSKCPFYPNFLMQPSCTTTAFDFTLASPTILGTKLITEISDDDDSKAMYAMRERKLTV